MLILQDITYIHPNHDVLFENVSMAINQGDKVALIGNNGAGKSTLLKIIAGDLAVSSGVVRSETIPYYIPQVFGQFNHFTIAQAIGIDEKRRALEEILGGNISANNLEILGDDWTIEERSYDALKSWGLSDVTLTQKMATLSGGQKSRVFLAGMEIHQRTFILLDEPSNHLDNAGRQRLYDFIQHTTATVIVVSHDRTLLNHLNTVCELSRRGVEIYGGNYDFYAEQKQIETNALNHDIHSKEKALRKAKESARETMERQQKLDARGKKKQEKAGVARIMMNTLRNNAENSTAKLKNTHHEKIGNLSEELQALRANLADIDKMKFGFDNSVLHKGKILVDAKGINFKYDHHLLWNAGLQFQIKSGQRIALKGSNGSGKTTLIQIVLNNLEPSSGNIYQAPQKSIYIDQDYSLINNNTTIFEQAQQFNTGGMEEHEIKIRLNRFLFTKEHWGKQCITLSGGERMRLMICCLTIDNQAPDMIVLDEPTNNLDIQNTDILTAALNEYEGTLLVVSHDEYFLKQIRINETILLHQADDIR